MAKFAVIFNGLITNTIIADTLADAQEASPAHATVVEDTTNTVGIGWTYDGTNFVAPAAPTTPTPGE
jgi:hypothetical protein